EIELHAHFRAVLDHGLGGGRSGQPRGQPYYGAAREQCPKNSLRLHGSPPLIIKLLNLFRCQRSSIILTCFPGRAATAMWGVSRFQVCVKPLPPGLSPLMCLRVAPRGRCTPIGARAPCAPSCSASSS